MSQTNYTIFFISLCVEREGEMDETINREQWSPLFQAIAIIPKASWWEPWLYKTIFQLHLNQSFKWKLMMRSIILRSIWRPRFPAPWLCRRRQLRWIIKATGSGLSFGNRLVCHGASHTSLCGNLTASLNISFPIEILLNVSRSLALLFSQSLMWRRLMLLFSSFYPQNQVSWVRRRDWHILSSGDSLYTNDARFVATHEPTQSTYTLQIKFVQKRDHGVYECQVSDVRDGWKTIPVEYISWVGFGVSWDKWIDRITWLSMATARLRRNKEKQKLEWRETAAQLWLLTEMPTNKIKAMGVA